MFDLQLRPNEPVAKFNRQLPMFNWHYPFGTADDRLSDPLTPFGAARSVPARRRAVYIHIPFCDTICSFCLFQKYKYQAASDVDRYLDALIAEIALKRALLGRLAVDCIFIGGGTPSVLEPEQIGRLGAAIHDAFDLEKLQEFTFEVEVKSVTPDKLEAMKAIGVNRVSFGAQTFSPKYRALFALDAPVERIFRTAEMINRMFPYTNVDILYGMAGQSEVELRDDALAAVQLKTTTIDFYPINNLTAPRLMHRQFAKASLAHLPEAVRVCYRVCLNDLLRAQGYAPINGYSYSRLRDDCSLGAVRQAPKFLYHDLVYGYDDDDVIGYGASALSQFNGFNLHNARDRHDYVRQLLDERSLPHEAFGPLPCPERGIVSFPFRGVLDHARIRWEHVPSDTWIALQEVIQAGLVVERPGRYELSPVGWLHYVNLMYYLMPKRSKHWLSQSIAQRWGDGRSSGDTDMSAWGGPAAEALSAQA